MGGLSSHGLFNKLKSSRRFFSQDSIRFSSRLNTLQFTKPGGEYLSFLLPPLLLTIPSLVKEIREVTEAMFRRTPTLGDALIYLLYGGDYEAMNRDGVKIPPPARSPGLRIPSTSFLMFFLRLQH